MAGALGDWCQLKKINAIIRPGDEIAITGKNEGKVSSTNPAGILATILYRTSLGEERLLSTGVGWVCDGKHPLLQGKNEGNTVWKRVKGSPIPKISADAEWIWSKSGSDKTTCVVKIPGPRARSYPGKIDVTVDNILDSIRINGRKINFKGSISDWSKLKTIRTKIRPGDHIEITGKNVGQVTPTNPAGIIATITHLSKNKKVKLLHTGSLWKCDGKIPLLQGKNSGYTLWKKIRGSSMPSIHNEAQWIWNISKSEVARCSVTIPGKKLRRIRNHKFRNALFSRTRCIRRRS
jgi:hypothetical protein